MKGEKQNMNKFITKIAKIFLGLSMAAGVGVAIGGTKKSVRANAETLYTFQTAANGSNTDYTKTYDVTISEVKWNVPGSQSAANYVYIGGKSITNVTRVIYSKDAISGNAGSIKMTFGAAHSSRPATVNSITMKVFSDATGASTGSGSTLIDTKTFTYTESGNSSVTPSSGKTWEDAYYRFEFNVTQTNGSNGYFSLNKIEFEKATGGGGGSGDNPLPSDIITYSTTGVNSQSGTGYKEFSGKSASNTGHSDAVYAGQCNKNSNDYIQLRKTNPSGIVSTTSGGKLKKVTIEWNSDTTADKYITVYAKNSAYSSGADLYSSSTYGTNLGNIVKGTSTTLSVSDDYTYVGLLASAAIYIDSITIDWQVGDVCTVTFNANGHGTAPDSKTVSSGSLVTEPTAPTATGYQFNGWYKEAGCTNAWDFDSDIVSEDTELFAKWSAYKYNINYFDQGGSAFSGTHASGYPTQHTYGTATTLKSATKTGYTFGGWFTTSACTGSSISSLGATAYTAAINLYAKWTPIAYSINYYDQGGSAFSGTHASGYPTQHTYGTATTLKSATKTGYTFDGWFTTSACTGSAVTSLGATAYTAAINLYAKWTIDSFDIGGTISNGSLSSTAKVNYNDALNVTIVPDTDYTYPSSIESVTMGGNPFDGYEYDSTDGSFYIEHVTGDVDIVAHCVDTSAVPYHVDYSSLSYCSIANAPETIYSNEIKELQIVPNDHYKLPLESDNKVSVSGIDSSKWSYDEDDGTITISEPDGNMTVSVECVAKAQNTISIGTLTGVSKVSGPSSVEEGDSATLTFTADSGYALPGDSGVSVTGTETYVWDQNTGELEVLGETSTITISITGIQRNLTDGSLTLGSKKTAYTLGDDFELPATVVANFNIAPTTVDVKNDVEVSGPVTKNNDKYVVTGSGTVTLTYTFSTTGKTQFAGYAITANSITPSAGGLAKVTKVSDLTVGSTVYLVTEQSSNELSGISTTSTKYGLYSSYSGTPSGAYALTVGAGDSSGTYSFANSAGNYLYWGSGNSLNVNGTLNANTSWNVSISNGNATITNSSNSERRLIWNAASNSLRFATYLNPSVDDTGNSFHNVQLYKNYPAVVKTLKWITAEVKSGTYYQGNSVVADNFNVTGHYDDGTSSSITTGITITNGYLANIGKNEVTITYSGLSYKVNVTAVEQTATLTGLSWSQGELTIVDGQAIDFSELGVVTASYDVAPSAIKALSACTVSIYTKSNETYTKVSDISDGSIITSSSHGKYLGVTYTEKDVTKYAYSSSPIYVVEALEEIYTKTKGWTYTEKATSLEDVEKVVMVASGFDYELTSVDTEASTNHGVGSEYTTSVAGTYSLTVEHISGNIYAFKDPNNKYLKWSSGNSLTLSAANADISEDANCKWAVTFDGTDAKLVNQGTEEERTLAWNNTTNSERFAFYKDSTITGQSKDNYSYVSFFIGIEGYSPTGSNLANTNAVAQKVVLEYATHFNDVMECVNGGTTSNVSGKWSDLAEDFDNWFNNGDKDLTELEVEHAKALFAGADAVEGGDTLQDMLARYEYICAKYKLDDFLSDAGRPQVAKSSSISPLVNIVGENTNTVAIIVIISMVSVTAIGGYFFLEKEKKITNY